MVRNIEIAHAWITATITRRILLPPPKKKRPFALNWQTIFGYLLLVVSAVGFIIHPVVGGALDAVAIVLLILGHVKEQNKADRIQEAHAAETKALRDELAETKKIAADFARQIGPWNISDDQFGIFATSIDREELIDTDITKSDVCYFAGDRDGKRIALRLAYIFMGTDWGRKHAARHIPDDIPANAAIYGCKDDGILILASPGEFRAFPRTAREGIQRIQTAFKESGIPAELIQFPQLPPAQVIIRVGRPPRSQAQ